MAEEAPVELKEEVTELAPFDPTKKKKKKKLLVQDTADEATETVTEKMENLSVNDGLDSAFTGMRRKKKKPVEGSFQDDDNVDSTEDAIEVIMRVRMKKGRALFCILDIPGRELIVITSMKSYLTEYSIFCVRTIQNLLEKSVELS